jgi:hypothetical protein
MYMQLCRDMHSICDGYFLDDTDLAQHPLSLHLLRISAANQMCSAELQGYSSDDEMPRVLHGCCSPSDAFPGPLDAIHHHRLCMP